MASTAFLDSRRAAYKQAVMALEADGQYLVNNADAALKTGSKKNIRMAQSYLTSEIPMNASTSEYVFNVIDQQYNVGNNNLLPSEKRLKQQDVFFTYAVGFYIRITIQSWQGEQQLLMTFPSATAQGPAPALFPDVQALIGIWTYGVLNVSVNGDVLTPAWDMSQHLCANQFQVGSITPPTGGQFDQITLSEDGQIIVEPNWIINGGNNNIYQLNYPNNYSNIFGGVNTGVTAQVNMVIKWYGFLAQNASSIMNNAPKKM